MSITRLGRPATSIGERPASVTRKTSSQSADARNHHNAGFITINAKMPITAMNAGQPSANQIRNNR